MWFLIIDHHTHTMLNFTNDMADFEIVVAVTDVKYPKYNEHDVMGIGYLGALPWPKCVGDMHHFRDLTSTTVNKDKRNAVVMGRKTFESMKCTPLPNRVNIVVSSVDYIIPNVIPALSLAKALKLAKLNKDVETVFVIGGQQLYSEAINHSNCMRVHMSRIDRQSASKDYECDRFFPMLGFVANFEMNKLPVKGDGYTYQVYDRKGQNLEPHRFL